MVNANAYYQLGDVENHSTTRAVPTFRGASAESMDPADVPRGIGIEPKCQQTLEITLSERSYPIYIGQNGLLDAQLLNQMIVARQVLIVTDKTVAALYLPQIKKNYAELQCDVVILPEGEAHKNMQSLHLIYDALIQNHHHRDTTLVALGGGVIGDITGFAAATYHRGVSWIYLPTTLLSQVDASIGGKTAVNHPLGKNMVGCFWQPSAVIMDVNALRTLPEREFRAGLAEMIKTAILVGGAFLDKLVDWLPTSFEKRDDMTTVEMIATCCKIKAEFVMEDEKEKGNRALLNLGHTFAHALEAHTHYRHWLHGEAVAIGLYCAALLSQQMGFIKQDTVDFIDRLLFLAKLPRRIPRFIDLEQIKTKMFQDKKIHYNHLRFILMKAVGNCYIENQVPDNCLHYILTCAATEGD